MLDGQTVEPYISLFSELFQTILDTVPMKPFPSRHVTLGRLNRIDDATGLHHAPSNASRSQTGPNGETDSGSSASEVRFAHRSLPRNENPVFLADHRGLGGLFDTASDVSDLLDVCLC